jgi:hypothetical protein
MSPLCTSLAALLGDEALSGGNGVPGECELIDSCRTIALGDCPDEDNDGRWKPSGLVGSSLIEAERGRSPTICEIEGSWWEFGEATSLGGD